METDSTAVATAPQPDHVLAAAIEQAHTAALDVGGEAVGEHLGLRADDVLVVTHAFAATLPGYHGWHWAVSLARTGDSDEPTVDEVVLLPGDGALLAPRWVPWDERVRAGDLGPGDLLPPPADDIRLVPGYVLSDDPDVEPVALELGLGRVRVMSREGRSQAAERWQAGEHGPDTPMARHAPATCGTCAFFLSLAGSLRGGFGVCGNEFTEADAHVVSVEYGCGAHSETVVVATPLAETVGIAYDDGEEFTLDEATSTESETDHPE